MKSLLFSYGSLIDDWLYVYIRFPFCRVEISYLMTLLLFVHYELLGVFIIINPWIQTVAHMYWWAQLIRDLIYWDTTFGAFSSTKIMILFTPSTLEVKHVMAHYPLIGILWSPQTLRTYMVLSIFSDVLDPSNFLQIHYLTHITSSRHT